MKKKQLNLTSGPILRTLSELALPIMASSFLSTAYNITDMAWIGMLGSKAVAGVGVGGMYVWLSQGLSSLARMGGQVNMAHSLGRGDQKTAAGFVQAALQLTILFSLLVTLISMLFTNPLLQFFALNDAETYNSARIYMRITCGLILFSFLSQVLTGLFTAQGDSKTPLKANFFGLILNMILDPLLVLGVGPFPRLEVIGAAVATVTAQIVVLLILVAEILRDHGEANVLHKIRLLSRPDIILLDEPTNHLDIESIQWLEDFLIDNGQAVVVISHDRAFVDHITTRTIEVTMGRIYDYKVNYSQYLQLRKERREQQQKAYDEQQKFIAETKDFIERFKGTYSKTLQVQSRVKMLEKLEILEVADEKTPDGASAAIEEQIKEKEAERVRKVLKDSAYTIALAIDGKQMTSENFAEKIQGLGIRGESHICFLIGGSLGMSDSLLRQADERISFSKMTFPHQLMRVILLEQIYRGFRIIHHEPYHK